MSKSKWLLPLIVLVVLSLAVSGCGGDKGKANESKENQNNEKTDEQAGDNPLTDMFKDVKGLKSDNPDKVIAEYKGGTFTQGEYDKYVNVLTFLSPEIIDVEKDDEFVKNIVNGYITTEIMADRAGKKVDAKEEADQFLKDWKSQYEQLLGTPEKVNEYMGKLYITDDDVKNYYSRYKNMDAYLSANISKDAPKQYYDEMKDDQFTKATVSHILIALEPTDAQGQPTGKKRTEEEALKEANDIIAKLKKGEDFAELAKKYSEDPGSKDNGGKYENAVVGQWAPGFKEAALTLEIGKISEPVKTTYGYHVMKVESRTVVPFEEAKKDIEADPQYANFAKSKVYEQFADKELPDLITKTDLPAGVKKETK